MYNRYNQDQLQGQWECGNCGIPYTPRKTSHNCPDCGKSYYQDAEDRMEEIREQAKKKKKADSSRVELIDDTVDAVAIQKSIEGIERGLTQTIRSYTYTVAINEALSDLGLNSVNSSTSPTLSNSENEILF